jgi:hypothetical protein
MQEEDLTPIRPNVYYKYAKAIQNSIYIGQEIAIQISADY